MIKLWNHNLLDGRAMNSCNMIIDDVKNKKLGSQVKPMRWKHFGHEQW
jgi:hypothetical protein